MTEQREIYCCGCSTKVQARLTSGAEVYPHRPDLKDIPIWRCDSCKNFVGCHHKTDEPTKPLGIIATPELKRARQHIHRLLDPIWKTGQMKRKTLYAKLTKRFGRKYHTADIRSIEEAREVWRFLKELAAKGA